jgi:hypothetical protein
VDADRPLCLLNLGPSRADEFFSPLPPALQDPHRLRFDLPSTDVLTQTADRLAQDHEVSRTLSRLLSSGITKSVDHVDEPAS